MSKPVFEPVNSVAGQSFVVKADKHWPFTSTYHYHPEYELTLINKGDGNRYIDNHIDQFNNGDLVLLGPNLPHCWKTDTGSKGETNTGSIMVQFKNDFLGEEFFNKPELSEIRKLLEKSQRGIIFHHTVVEEISKDLETLAKEPVDFRKVHVFLEILHKLSVTSAFTLSNGSAFIPAQNGNDPERINKVFDYIMDNYKTNVSLHEVSGLACMTPNAFCKYFKKITQKTFIEVVVEHRIQYAKSQLLHTNKSVTQVCFDSGFNDIVYFTRMFKSKMQVSPLQYKKKFLKNFNLINDSHYSGERIN